ncbi:MAG: hypothetical protein A2X86_09170 [Bdellovibrionales bacterium GWA2_49_15]|nr:MAG: hypothetical protein A2X86_09170 [Bdellovibrionales bacterium GWA2_49_15]HAZ12948.1 hypothetical protein [Bdellovibrionales bacterium]
MERELRRKFTPLERHAIWLVYGKLCNYCDSPLTFRETEIEHIVPFSLFATSPEKTKAIKKELGLSEDFDPNDYANLTLSCRKCNLKKSNIQLKKEGLLLLLGIAEKNKNRIIKQIETLKKQDVKVANQFKLARAFSSGSLNEQDVSEIILKHKNIEGVFNLSSPISIFGNMDLRELSKERIEEYQDSTSILPDWLSEGLELDDSFGNKKIVRTLREYKIACSAGYYPMSNAATKTAYAVFELPMQVLKHLENSTYADTSYIDNPRLGLPDINLLPASLLCSFEDYESEKRNTMAESLSPTTIGDLIENGEAIISRLGSALISIHWRNYSTFMLELMRADFNNDGVQELLIHWGGGPLDGTLSTGNVIVLCKKDESSKFTMMKESDVHE